MWHYKKSTGNCRVSDTHMELWVEREYEAISELSPPFSRYSLISHRTASTLLLTSCSESHKLSWGFTFQSSSLLFLFHVLNVKAYKNVFGWFSINEWLWVHFWEKNPSRIPQEFFLKQENSILFDIWLALEWHLNFSSKKIQKIFFSKNPYKISRALFS